LIEEMARIEHFALFAADLEQLRAFYEHAFGLRVIVDNSRAPVRGYFLADDAAAVLEIIERPAGVETGSTRYVCHVAFAVDDIEKARERLEAGGASFETETAVNQPEMKTYFFDDPAGNRCQIVWRRMPLGE
jgi:glyoxylase I family protein